jgi:uncharacterized protein involved in tolerance to divalent cations
MGTPFLKGKAHERLFMTDKIVVFVNCANAKEAEEIARSLVEKRLAACVNVLPGLTSWYWWENKLTQDQEILMVIKSSREMFGELEKEGPSSPFVRCSSGCPPNRGRLRELSKLD